MIRRIAISTIWLAVAAAANAQGRLEGSGLAGRFISERYGFSIAVPLGWHVSLEKDTPMFINFNSAQGVSQLTLPKGGAAIAVVAQDALRGRRRLAASPSDWARIDARQVASGNSPAQSLDMPKESGILHAVVSSYDEATYSPDDQAQHCTAVFWEFDKKLFAAHLFYVAGDPKGRDLEKIFVDTIRGIRPLRKSDQY